MSQAWQKWWGTVPLKDGVKPTNVIALYESLMADEAKDPQLPLVEPSGYRDNDNEVDLDFAEGEFSYTLNGDPGWSTTENFEKFLDEVAKQFASAGWASREGDEDTQDDEATVFRGPSELASAEAELAYAKFELETAQGRLKQAQERVQELQVQEAPS